MNDEAQFLLDPFLYRRMPILSIGMVIMAYVIAGGHLPPWLQTLCGVAVVLGAALVYADVWCRRRLRAAVAMGAAESSVRSAYHAVVRVRLAAMGGVVVCGTLSLVCVATVLAIALASWH